MSINTEPLNTSGASINQSQSVCSASRELEHRKTSIVGAGSVVAGSFGRAIKVHLAIDEVVVRTRSRIATRLHDAFNDLEIWSVEPILKKDWPEIDIIVALLVRPMDNHGSKNSSCVLRGVMAMIPRTSLHIVSSVDIT